MLGSGKYPFYSNDVRSRREDKAVLRWLWEKEGGSRDWDKVVRNRVQIASPAGAHFLGLENDFIIFYVPSTETFLIAQKLIGQVKAV